MASQQTIFEFLANSQDPAADSALLSALANSDPSTAESIVEIILRRNQRAGLLGLVQSFHLLHESLRQSVMVEADRLFSVLREASQSRDEQIRLNVIEIISRGALCRAGYLLDTALHDRSSRIREAAADALYCVAAEWLQAWSTACNEASSATTDPETLREQMTALETRTEDRRQLVATIESALLSFDIHQQSRVVEAAMWFADDWGINTWNVLAQPTSRAGHIAVKLLTEVQDPRLVPFFMLATNYSRFRPYVIKTLATLRNEPAFMTEFLRQSWRLVQPRMLRVLNAMREALWAKQFSQDVLAMPADAQRHAPRFLLSLGLHDDLKADVLGTMAKNALPAGQQAAVWALTRWSDTASTHVLRWVEESGKDDLARIAWRELVRRRPLQYPLGELVEHTFGKLKGSRPDRSNIDSFSNTPMSFEQYWASFNGLNPRKKRELGRYMLEAHPLATAILHRRLCDANNTDRIQALRMVGVLDLTQDFAELIYRLSKDPAAEVRSSAVILLGRLPTSTSQHLLQGALNDRDMRVQANAVEAVEVTGNRTAIRDLLPKLSSSDNRVRANAVRALLRLGVREAAETLLIMLQDNNRAQRASALWLIDHMGLSALTRRVLTVAATDADNDVRQRARTLADKLTNPNTPTPVATGSVK